MVPSRLNFSRKAAPQALSTDMQGPLIVSLLLHVMIVVGFSVGLPHLAKKSPMIVSPPVSVEIVNIDLMTQTNKVAPTQKKEEPPTPEKPSPQKPEPAKMTAEAPPDLLQPKAPEVPDPVPMPEEVEKPEPIQPKEIKKKPEPPKKKTEPKVTKKPQDVQQNDFASLLKNLTPDANEQVEEQPDDAVKDAPAESGQIARLADTLSISEQDALRRQLGRCWNVMAGAKYAEDLVVEVRVFMNPDRTVNRASILDQGRYNRDSHFRAAADAAIRALRNPRCSPLQLPPDKYEQWQTILINFDPRDML